MVEDRPDGQGQIIYLDKPLVPHDLSIKEKNLLFYKMSLKRWLLQNQQGLTMNATPDQLNLDLTQLSTMPGAQIPQTSQGPDNLVYSEWQMDDYQVLIRGRLDALARAELSPSGAASQPTHRPTGIVCKMKHVPDEHLEEFSTSEKAKYLLKAWLLGDVQSKLVVGHVDPVSARLISVEVLSQQQLRAPGSPSAESYLGQLHDLLTWLKTQVSRGPAQFLLTHAPGEQHVSLVRLQADKTQLSFSSGIAASYDLHERQKQAGRTNAEVIDYLPPRWDYQRLHQIPNTFLPASRSCCFDFLRSGKCSHPTTCTHVHMTQYEAELRSIPTLAALSKPTGGQHDAKRQDHPSQSTTATVDDQTSGAKGVAASARGGPKKKGGRKRASDSTDAQTPNKKARR